MAENRYPRLNAHEARVLGVLVEKQLTTPDGYPLSLNALTSGSNQKSNRDPITDFTEAEVTVALQGLVVKHLAGRVVPAGSRVEKWRHNSRETLHVDDAELALVAELLMRGPQTPGELRSRAARMAPQGSLDDLSRRLTALAERGLVQRLDPAPGTRAERYAQLLSPDLHPLAAPAARVAPAVPAPPGAAADSAGSSTGLAQRVEALEGEVRELRERLEDLCVRLGGA